METNSRHARERVFFLDCARKYYTPAWIKRLMRAACDEGFNTFTLHFSEEMALRLESKKYPWLAGGDHSLCVFGSAMGCAEDDGKFYTQEEMEDLVRFAQGLGMNVIPSFDSPGHMNYIVKKYNARYGTDISNYFHKNGQVSIVHGSSRTQEEAQLAYSRGIDLTNPDAVALAKALYEEYGRFFRSLGCTDFDIGGDELLGFGDTIDDSYSKWQNLEHWEAYAREKTGNENAVAYDTFLLYVNEISALMKSLGYRRILMWNDEIYRDFDTGYTGVVQPDRDLVMQYWQESPNGGNSTVFTYLDRGHKVLNFNSQYVYYTLGIGSYHGASPEQVENDWSAYTFDSQHPENNPTPPDERVLGGGYCIWSDQPAAESEEEVLEHVLPFLKAAGKALRG
jgi:hexosaminidase